MEDSVSVQCPYCGQNCVVELDPTIARQQFTTDCEVCCRPFTIYAECEAGEIVSLQAEPE